MNKFTLMIHNKGWTVTGACERWVIHYDTYNRRCNNPKFHAQLEDMCNGLEDKSPFNKDDFAVLLDIKPTGIIKECFK